MIAIIVKIWEGIGKIETFPIFLICSRDSGRISTISSAICRKNLGCSGNSEIADRLGFSREKIKDIGRIILQILKKQS